MDQHQLVQAQFGAVSEAYAKSSTHNDQAVLDELVALIAPKPHETALDIATGPGTVALALAPHVQHVTAFDLTQSMLDTAERRAKEQGFTNFDTKQGSAENLPFEDASFDVVAVRTAPHHYADIQAAVNEMARVVKPTGRVVIVDTTSPEEDNTALELHEIEKLRDPSHVRNYKPSEWREFLAKAGLRITFERIHTHALGKRLFFNEWVTRMRVSEDAQKRLWAMFTQGSPALKEVLEVRELDGDLSFTLPEITIVATLTEGDSSLY